MVVLAHGAEGLTGDGVPGGLLYGIVIVGVVLGVVGLRASGTALAGPTVPPATIDGTEAGAWPGDALPAPVRVGGQVLGVALLALFLAVGWVGSALSGLNPLPVTMITVVWWSVPLLALLLGDWWRVIDPYDALAGWIDRARGRALAEPDDEADDWWVPAALLVSFAWMTTGWLRGQEPRSMAGWLTALTVVMVVGGIVGGRAWVRRSSPIAVLTGLVAAASPIAWEDGRVGFRSPLRGLAGRAGGRRALAVVVVMIGATLWEVVAGSSWWGDLVGTSATGVTPVWALFGLTATIGVVAGVWWAITHLAEIAASARGATVPEPLSGDLAVAVAATAAVAPFIHQFSTLLVYAQDLIAMASDPFAQGLDLFGTARWRADDALVSAAFANWLQLTLLGAALALLVGGGWDRLLARIGAVAVDVVWAVAVAAGLIGVVFLRYLLGA